MTREVAIKAIQDFIGWFKEDSLIRKALDMAIQALSQEPTFDDECQKDMDEAWEQIQKKRKRIPVTLDSTPCDDAISRAELLKAIDTWDKFGVDDTNSLFRLDNLSLPYYVPYIHYDDVIKCIKGMPSVTQKSKKGHWIGYCYEYYRCSECNYIIADSDVDEYEYCPNCGAKMESEDKG